METKTTPVHPLLLGATPGEYIIDGSSIFVLNEDGTNRISAQVQRGWESQWKDGCIRTTNEEVEAVARLFRAAPSLAADNALLAEQVERLREGLENIARRADHQIPAYATEETQAGSYLAGYMKEIWSEARDLLISLTPAPK